MKSFFFYYGELKGLKKAFFGISFISYNSHTIQLTHLKCTVQWFLAYSQLCNHHHVQFCIIFITPKETAYPLAVLPHFSLMLPTQTTTNLLSLSMYLPIIDISCKWNHIPCSLFYNWLISLIIVLLKFIRVVTCISTSFLLVTK